MPSGSCWIFFFKAESHQNNLIRVYLDVNGAIKKPNRAGIDLYNFIITTKGQVIPNTVDDCYPEHKNDKGMGLDCAAKIMENGWKFTDDYPFNW